MTKKNKFILFALFGFLFFTNLKADDTISITNSRYDIWVQESIEKINSIVEENHKSANSEQKQFFLDIRKDKTSPCTFYEQSYNNKLNSLYNKEPRQLSYYILITETELIDYINPDYLKAITDINSIDYIDIDNAKDLIKTIEYKIQQKYTDEIAQKSKLSIDNSFVILSTYNIRLSPIEDEMASHWEIWPSDFYDKRLKEDFKLSFYNNCSVKSLSHSNDTEHDRTDVLCSATGEEIFNMIQVLLEMKTSEYDDYLTYLKGLEDPLEIINVINKRFSYDIEKIEITERIRLLKILSTIDLTDVNGGEKATISLIKYLPDNQVSELLSQLKSNKLVSVFSGKIDGGNFTLFVNTLVAHINYINPSPDKTEFESKVIARKFIHFDGSFWGKTLQEYFTEDNNVILKQGSLAKPLKVEADPYEWIAVKFEKDFTVNGRTFYEGSDAFIPAIGCYWLFNEANSNRLLKSTVVTVNVALMVVGVGELSTALEAKNALQVSFAIADIGLSAGTIIMDTYFAEKLNKTESGKSILYFWNILNLGYAGGRISSSLYTAAKYSSSATDDLLKTLKDLTQEEKDVLNKLKLKADEITLNSSFYKNEPLVQGAGSLVELTVNGKLIGKFTRGSSLEIIDDITIHGGNKINLSPNKTTTITGTLDDVEIVASRGRNVDNTLNGITASNVANEGGISILRSPKWGQIKSKYKSVFNGQTTFDWPKITDEFWETVNKPWLDDAISRGDNIRFVSSPTNAKAIHVTDDLGNFVFDVNGNKIKSIFGREIDYLKSKGYTILNDGTAVK